MLYRHRELLDYVVDAIQIKETVDAYDQKYRRGTFIYWDSRKNELVYSGEDTFNEHFILCENNNIDVDNNIDDEDSEKTFLVNELMDLGPTHASNIAKELGLWSMKDPLSISTEQLYERYFNRAKEKNILEQLIISIKERQEN
jgi:hypothetical protein